MCFREDYIFKIASDKGEFEQIHDLNYKTFVEEIPQHQTDNTSSLVDKFHNENTYIICLRKGELVGMIAVRDKRPFSLDCKLENLDKYLPDCSSLCELRLLSIKKEYRNRKIISGLFSCLAGYCESNNYDLALISANIKELSLYRKLGFREFGEIVGKEKAYYQPMYLTMDSYKNFKRETKILRKLKTDPCKTVNFLPGPSSVASNVRAAFEADPVSHRSSQFIVDFKKTKELLCDLTKAKNVEIFMGSGTLANDVIAAQISRLEEAGLVLSNGHFGDRLVDHCKRFSLDFKIFQTGWGKSFDYSKIENLVKNNGLKWIWFVHCETSSGVVNDLERLKVISRNNSLKLCADCISSIGTCNFSLDSVYLASGVSGKALCSYPGLSFVFYNHELSKDSALPRYMDIQYYRSSGGIPFTISSNLLYALKKTLENNDIEINFAKNNKLILNLRKKLVENGIELLSDNKNFSHNYLTFRIAENISSTHVGERLEEYGYLINYMSEYLLKKNLLQIALLGSNSEYDVENFLKTFFKILNSANS